MIKKHYLFPECYVAKIPYCDDCNIQLRNTDTQILTNPASSLYVCPKCGKEYYFSIGSLEGEWKWKVI